MAFFNDKINLANIIFVLSFGVFIGISSDGSLNLKLKDGKIKNYEHGEISIEGIY